LFRNGSEWAVFVAGDDGKARQVPVRIGHMNDDVAELLGGLRAGSRVILHPSDRLEEGSPIEERN
jgi:HlyD family secretion protein